MPLYRMLRAFEFLPFVILSWIVKDPKDLNIY